MKTFPTAVTPVRPAEDRFAATVKGVKASAHLLDTDMAMEGSFGADVALSQKGTYVFEVGTKLGKGEKRQFRFESLVK